MARSVWKGPFLDRYLKQRGTERNDARKSIWLRAVTAPLRNRTREVGKSQKSNGRLVSAPGSFARSVLDFVFSKKAFDDVFSQAIIDMREEHADALANQRTWKAKWIVIRDHMGLCLTVATYVSVSVGKKVATIWNMIT